MKIPGRNASQKKYDFDKLKVGGKPIDFPIENWKAVRDAASRKVVFRGREIVRVFRVK